MTFDLRTENWIPWQRRSGVVEFGAPWLLTDQITQDPVVAIAAPRPDFQGALLEFLIGLLGVSLQVVDDEGWIELWKQAPSPEDLQAALGKLPAAFDLDGDGPRFFQAYPADDLARETPLPIDELLVDSKTSTLFVKRGRVQRMSRSSAAMALITMQTYAPEGGRGHLTSLRGGGPLTTIVDPRVDRDGEPLAHQLPLWQKLWANVETTEQAASRAPRSNHNTPADIFPWLAPVRTAAGSTSVVVESNTSPWQAYFGLPRRIRFEFDGPGICDLTGREDDVTIMSFRLRPNGVRYGTWRHPLTPHYRSSGKEMLPLHGQPGGIGWHDWLGLTFGTPDEKRAPAAVITEYLSRAKLIGIREARVHAFGYDTEKAKIRGWTDASQPVFKSQGEISIKLIATNLTEATSITASLLEGAMKRALFDRPTGASGDFSLVRSELWDSTEQEFFNILRVASMPPTTQAMVDENCAGFRQMLWDKSLMIFDRWCPGDESTPQAMRRVVAARYELSRAFGGWTPLGEKLFTALRIPLPGGGRAARKIASRTRKTKEKM